MVYDAHRQVTVSNRKKDPRIIRVQTYDTPDTPDGKAFFYVPYRTAEPGTRLRLRGVTGEPLDEMRLRMDRDADGSCEESWMPEATVVGAAVEVSTPPEAEMHLEELANGSSPLLYLHATDDPAPDDDSPSSGVGVIY